jgi:hypothetical protein
MNINELLGKTLPELWGIFQPSGDVGIEFECEGTLYAWNSPLWQVKQDHSLRNGYEWVTRLPISIERLPETLDEFFSYADQYNCLFNDSIRTSIHVHVNASRYKLYQIYNILTAYYLIEPLLVKYSGPLREGNLFCLRMQDADFTVQCLIQGLQNLNHFGAVNNDNFKYAALNLSALANYGSLEFRSMRGDYHSKAFIQGWIDALFHLCQMAAALPNPKEVVGMYKSLPQQEFLYRFLPKEFASTLIEMYQPHLFLMDDAFHYSFSLAAAIPDWTVKDYVKPKRTLKIKKPVFVDSTIDFNATTPDDWLLSSLNIDTDT